MYVVANFLWSTLKLKRSPLYIALSQLTQLICTVNVNTAGLPSTLKNSALIYYLHISLTVNCIIFTTDCMEAHVHYACVHTKLHTSTFTDNIYHTITPSFSAHHMHNSSCAEQTTILLTYKSTSLTHLTSQGLE